MVNLGGGYGGQNGLHVHCRRMHAQLVNPVETVLGEQQHETEGVTVARHGVGTGTLLGYQTIREEPLEESRKAESVRCSPPGTCTVPRRLAAMGLNSVKRCAWDIFWFLHENAWRGNRHRIR